MPPPEDVFQVVMLVELRLRLKQWLDQQGLVLARLPDEEQPINGPVTYLVAPEHVPNRSCSDVEHRFLENARVCRCGRVEWR